MKYLAQMLKNFEPDKLLTVLQPWDGVGLFKQCFIPFRMLHLVTYVCDLHHRRNRHPIGRTSNVNHSPQNV